MSRLIAHLATRLFNPLEGLRIAVKPCLTHARASGGPGPWSIAPHFLELFR